MLFQCRSSASRICADVAARISRLTMTTISRGGNRCRCVRKLSRNRRLSALRFTAFGTCLRAIANPSLGRSPSCLATRIVSQASPIRKLLLNTCWKSRARVSLDRRGKDALRPADTLRRQARPALGPTSPNHGAPAAGSHPRAKAVRTRTPEVAGLKGTFHDRSLGSSGLSTSTRRDNLLVAPRHVNIFMFSFNPDRNCQAVAGEWVNSAQKFGFFGPRLFARAVDKYNMGRCRSRFGNCPSTRARRLIQRTTMGLGPGEALPRRDRAVGIVTIQPGEIDG